MARRWQIRLLIAAIALPLLLWGFDGTQSGLWFTNTFVVHLPWWRFRVVAEGYEPGEWTVLDVPEHIRQARRAGPRRAKLVVPIALHKRLAEPKAPPERGGR
jgi:hypothetical protein